MKKLELPPIVAVACEQMDYFDSLPPEQQAAVLDCVPEAEFDRPGPGEDPDDVFFTIRGQLLFWEAARPYFPVNRQTDVDLIIHHLRKNRTSGYKGVPPPPKLLNREYLFAGPLSELPLPVQERIWACVPPAELDPFGRITTRGLIAFFEAVKRYVPHLGAVCDQAVSEFLKERPPL